MSRKDKNYMPQSTAGLIRYFDGTKKGKKLKPEHILGFCVFLIILEIMVKFMA
jgi:preprotein translocase subunit Sec61beta